MEQNEGLLTDEALVSILWDPVVYKSLDEAGRSTIRAHRKRFKDQRLPLEKKYEILREYGFRLIQDAKWDR